jgi:hypothetical protein
MGPNDVFGIHGALYTESHEDLTIKPDGDVSSPTATRAYSHLSAAPRCFMGLRAPSRGLPWHHGGAQLRRLHHGRRLFDPCPPRLYEGMESKQLQRIIGAKVVEYAQGVPSAQRGDFIQDMWVTLLGIGIERALRDKLSEGGASAIDPFLNLILFRTRDNWLDKRCRHQKRRVSFEQATTACAATTTEDMHARLEARAEAREVAENLRVSLRASGFSKEETQLILEGLRDGLMFTEIAASVGMPAPNLYYYIKQKGMKRLETSSQPAVA